MKLGTVSPFFVLFLNYYTKNRQNKDLIDDSPYLSRSQLTNANTPGHCYRKQMRGYWFGSIPTSC